MSIDLTQYLDDLSARIDSAQEQANRQAWLDFVEDRCSEDIFVPPPRHPAPPRIDWPKVSVNDAMNDADAMLLHQFAAVSDVLTASGGDRLNVRCNYGTGIGATLFGCELFMMDESLDTLPTSKPLGQDRLAALLDAGMPDLCTGLGASVFEAAGRFLEVFQRWDALGENIELYHPDMQGPIDIAELVWGSEMFYAFYDDTELLQRLLALITETYIAFMHKWYGLIGKPEAVTTHWGCAQRGALMIRNDSLMNLSPDIYAQFVRPLDQRCFDELGGCAIHFCGRGDHFIELMSEMRGLSAIQLSQPEYNEMETIYRHTVDKEIKLLGLDPTAARAAGRPLRGQVHCRE